jgi:hypothetical protein
MRSRIIATAVAVAALFGGSALLPASAVQAPAPRTASAVAPAGSVDTAALQNNAVTTPKIAPHSVWQTQIAGPVNDVYLKTYNKTVGPSQFTDATRAQVLALANAYYSVAFYDSGDTNAGAIATVACKNVTDTAISGGVSVVDFTKNTPVSSSFPGRMDWTTNTPLADRLDGWIVQFGGNAGTVSDKDPLKVKIYALCVPGLDIPSIQTYTQSADN